MTAGSRWLDGSGYVATTERFQRRNAELVALLAGPRPGQRVLDVGCGTGWLSLAVLGRAACDVVALDPSSSMLEQARAEPELAGVEFHETTFERFAGDGPFDLIVSNAAFHWLHPGYAEALTKMRDLLAPDGVIQLCTAGRTADSEEFDARMLGLTAGLPPVLPGVPFHERRLDAPRLHALASEAGLSVLDCFSIGRHARVDVYEYVRWLQASGGPWEAGAADEASRRLAERVGGPELDVGHFSLMARLER